MHEAIKKRHCAFLLFFLVVFLLGFFSFLFVGFRRLISKVILHSPSQFFLFLHFHSFNFITFLLLHNWFCLLSITFREVFGGFFFLQSGCLQRVRKEERDLGTCSHKYPPKDFFF